MFEFEGNKILSSKNIHRKRVISQHGTYKKSSIPAHSVEGGTVGVQDGILPLYALQ